MKPRQFGWFRFDEELYGKRMRIHCVRAIRREKHFSGRDELKAQLVQDREKTLGILEKE